MKRSVIWASFFLMSTGAAWAENFRVPEGRYVGTGVWSDTAGNSGTLDSVYIQGHDGEGAEASINLSNGQKESYRLKFTTIDRANYLVAIDAGDGQFVTIGSGVCGPAQCETTLHTSETDVVNESAAYDGKGGLYRIGSVHTGASVMFYQTWMRRIRK